MQPDAQTLEVKTSIGILRPAPDVFDAIVNPSKMTVYFISESSGMMESGVTLQWRFPEFDETFPVRVDLVEPNSRVVFRWHHGTVELLVDIALSESPQGTKVTVRETATENNGDLSWLKGNTEGWANFLACLKAYVEHGINLRKGAFEF